jgi:hypothetical protein
VNRRLALLAGVLMLLLAGLAAWLVVRDRGPQAAGPAEFYQPNPAAAQAPEDLKGVWTGTAASPKGDARREHVIRFVDATHLVWEFMQIGRDDDGGELRFTVSEWANGERTFPPKSQDKDPRVYEFTRPAGDGGFRVRPKPSEPGFNWFDVTFHRAEE